MFLYQIRFFLEHNFDNQLKLNFRQRSMFLRYLFYFFSIIYLPFRFHIMTITTMVIF